MSQHLEEQPQTPDKVLVMQVKAGDKHAFDQLVEKYQFRIMKLVSRYVTDPSEALDIAQDSFMKAFNAIHNFRGDSAFYTWLYRIAINTAKNHALSRNKRIIEADVEVVDMDQVLTRANLKDYATPERTIYDTELQDAIQEIIKHLPKELRTAITLREMEGLSYDEIAEVMDCPVGTVRSRIFRAREVVQRRMKPLLTETYRSV